MRSCKVALAEADRLSNHGSAWTVLLIGVNCVADLFDANYTGVVRVIRAALLLMRRQGSGHILA